MHRKVGLPVVIVLASGRGARFIASGGTTHKLKALLHGKSVLQHTLDAVRACGLPWHVEEGDHPGMGDTISAAVNATRHAPGWLILPGDLPLVQPDTLCTVAQAQAADAVVVPRIHGKRGHPVSFSEACLTSLLALSGDQGAASVIRSHRHTELIIDDIGCVTDIDTVEDLRKAEMLYLMRR